MSLDVARIIVHADQNNLAELSSVPLPTTERMEAGNGNVRGVVDILIEVADAFNKAGIKLIGEHSRSGNCRRGVCLRQSGTPSERSR